MAFEVKVYSIKIKEHPDADALELAQIGDYLSCVKKGQFKTGDLVAYIPEAALIPDNLLDELGLKGRLAGSKGNRVKALRLRGVLSQGIVYPAKEDWKLGQDVQQELGIIKWEPPIPQQLEGEVGVCDLKLNFDIENIKKYPDLFIDGEEVTISEKIHGTCCIFCVVPPSMRKEDMIQGKYLVSNKRQIEDCRYLKDNERNEKNTYIKVVKEHQLGEKLEKYFSYTSDDKPIWILGEVYGSIQDLKYGVTGGKNQYRAFGIKIGHKWLDYDAFIEVCGKLDIPTVPILYQGPYSKEIVLQHTDGKETVSGNNQHIREGVVITTTKYRQTQIGRAILKSKSDAYETRNQGTEFV